MMGRMKRNTRPEHSKAWAKDVFDRTKHQLVKAIRDREITVAEINYKNLTVCPVILSNLNSKSYAQIFRKHSSQSKKPNCGKFDAIADGIILANSDSNTHLE